MKEKIVGLILGFMLLTSLFPIPAMAAGGAYLNLTTSPNTPRGQNVVIGSTDIVTLKTIFTTSVPGLGVNDLQLRVDIFREDGMPAQSNDISDVYLSANNGRLTTKKNTDSSNSSSITFKPDDWLIPLPISTENGTELSVALKIPSTCNASGSGLFVVIDGKNIVAPCPVSGSANGTVMKIVQSGSLMTYPAPDAPPKRIVAIGADGTEEVATKLNLIARDEAFDVTSVTVQRIGGRDADFTTLSLLDGLTELYPNLPMINGETTFYFPAHWEIPSSVTKTLNIKAKLAGIATENSSGSISGDAPKLCIAKISGIGAISGQRIDAAVDTSGNEMILRKSKPTLVAASLSSTVLGTGEKVIYRWTITADPKGPVSWNATMFEVSGAIKIGSENFTIGLGDLEPSNVFSDGIYMHSSNGTIKKLIPRESLKVYRVDTGELVNGAVRIWNFGSQPLILFTTKEISTGIRGDVNNDGKVDALDLTKLERIIAGLDREEQTISTGETKTYELRSTLLYAGQSGDSIGTRIPNGTDNSTFDWSDGVTWATNYLIPGIPTATLSLTK